MTDVSIRRYQIAYLWNVRKNETREWQVEVKKKTEKKVKLLIVSQTGALYFELWENMVTHTLHKYNF